MPRSRVSRPKNSTWRTHYSASLAHSFAMIPNVQRCAHRNRIGREREDHSDPSRSEAWATGSARTQNFSSRFSRSTRTMAAQSEKKSLSRGAKSAVSSAARGRDSEQLSRERRQRRVLMIPIGGCRTLVLKICANLSCTTKRSQPLLILIGSCLRH